MKALICDRCGKNFKITNITYSDSDLFCLECIDLIESFDSEIAANLHERGI